MNRIILRYILTALTFAVAGCSPPAPSASHPERRPLASALATYVAPAAAAGETDDLSRALSPSDALTLRQALALALLHNPELAAASWEVRTAEARALQASLLPNPELESEVEEVAGEGPRGGLDAAEASLALSQLVELGGKRAHRTRVAAFEGELAGWDYEARRLELLGATARAFVAALAAQERLALAEDLVALARRGQETVAEKVKAGKVSAVEADKARVALATSRIERARARRGLAARRRELAALWGAQAATFERVEGDLERIGAVPSAAQLGRFLAEHPEVARWAVEVQHRQARLALERAGAVPDITVSGGVQYFNESDEGAFIFGVAVPLPVFDRNQGGIREALGELSKAREERRAAIARLSSELAAAHGEFAAAHDEVTALRSDVLPAAKAAYEAEREGYRQGKFAYLDVLDAQRTLFEARRQLIDALAAYHKAAADVERLIGQSLDSIATEARTKP